LLLVPQIDGFISQQDGAPVHVGAIVRTALDEQFSCRWIGRGGRINWPPLTPDLTPMDFFWGYIKDIVHSERIDYLLDLSRRITATIAALPVDVLSRVCGEMEFRVDVCRAINGAHIALR
jgi:hypothetical protein